MLEVAVGKTATIEPNIIPENAYNKNVSWKTSNTAVATVENGIVTGVAVGKSTITVTTEDGNRTATCLVNVLQPIEPEMVRVEGGKFTMGCSDEECYDYELPLHEVTLTDFNIAKYPVTQKEWMAIMGNVPTSIVNDDIFVYRVTWNDTQVYITKLNALTGKNYRLPTEAEWEYAARGGNKSKDYKYSGSDDIDDVAWYDGNSNNRPQYVGKKMPNELGIYDMSGNQWEFCSDWYGAYSNVPKINPTGPEIGEQRVTRGGAFNNVAFWSRVSSRSYWPQDKPIANGGFRLVHP